MLKKLLLIASFISYSQVKSSISPRGTHSQIIFGTGAQLQANATMSGLSNTVLFPANSNFQLNNSNPSASLGGISSTAITFGQDNVIQLTGDAIIGQSDQTWIFPYDAMIDGKGHTLTILAPQGITVSGSATLTITNAKIICGARQSLGCTSDTATILLDKTTLILGSEGLFWGQGNLTIGTNVFIQGQDKSFFATPSNSEFTTQLTTLGFSVTTQQTNSSLYTMDFSGPSDDRAGISMVALDKTSTAYYSDDNSPTTRTWHSVPGGLPFANVSIGIDGTIWLVDVGANVYVYRVNKDSTPNMLTAQNITANVVAVGNRFNVYALNTTTGKVYKCSDPDRGYLNNPLTGAPQTWVQVPNVKASSIAAGSDGSLWYINVSGQVILQDPNGNETLLHDGSGHTFVKVSAKGTATKNSVALTCLVTSRAYISHNNGPFKDLGLANVVEAATDVDGNIMIIFDNSIIPEDPTHGAPIYYRHSFAEHPVLAMDRTLNFSASNGANLTIASGGTLTMREGTTLRMSADSGALETAYNARRHLVFTDNSSTLLLDRANIEAVCAGLTLTSGTVIVNGVCGLFPSSLPGCQTEISADVKLKIHADSNLQTYGQVDYCAATRLYNPVQTVNIATDVLSFNFQLSSLFLRGFIRTTSPLPFSNVASAVAYNTSLNKIKVFSGFYVYSISTQLCYYIAEIENASIVPTLTNFQNRGLLHGNGTADLGDDNSILYTDNPSSSVVGYLTGDSNSPQNIASGSSSGVHPIDVSIANSTNYGVSYSNGELFWWKPSGAASFSSLGQRSFSVTSDALWYVNNIGEIWYIPASNTNLSFRYTGSRGLDIVRICVRGPLNNYKIMACDRHAKIYSSDICRPLEFENIYKSINYIPFGLGRQTGDGQPFSITTTGFASITMYSSNLGIGNSYFGYMRGYRPSTWYSGGDTMINTFLGFPLTSSQTMDTATAMTKGFAPPYVFGADLTYSVNMKARHVGNQIELRYGYRDAMNKQVFNQDLTHSAAPTSYAQGFMAGGSDGSYVYIIGSGYPYSGPYFLYYVDPNGNQTLILSVQNLLNGNVDRNYEFWDTGEFYVAMNDANSLYIIFPSIGKLQKWAGGTSWTDIYTDYSGMPLSMSPSTDGGFWYATRQGKLNYKASNGTITAVKGSQGNKWVFVTTAGSSSQYKLLAVRQDGMLFSADQSRGLENEGIYSVESATILDNGFFICRGTAYFSPPIGAGWIKGTAPKWWQKLYPITA